jgi:hypothetical protein
MSKYTEISANSRGQVTISFVTPIDIDGEIYCEITHSVEAEELHIWIDRQAASQIIQVLRQAFDLET